MDAVKFFKTANRLCKNQGCNVCPVAKEGCCMVGFDDDSVKNIEETISKVEQWAKDHPVKTSQSEFLKMFPNAKCWHNERGDVYIEFCPKLFNNTLKCRKDGSGGCSACMKEYWSAEVE